MLHLYQLFASVFRIVTWVKRTQTAESLFLTRRKKLVVGLLGARGFTKILIQIMAGIDKVGEVF